MTITSIPEQVPGEACTCSTTSVATDIHERLVREQARTLATPRRRPTLVAWVLFKTMDVLYGRRRTLEKFLVLELVARVPYQTWEHAAYLKITRHARETRLARRIYDRVCRSREQQDNEQWHLFILEDTLEHRGRHLGWFRFRMLPQLIAFTYYVISWLMYLVRPAWSYRLNADFEDHAEHEYALFVFEHPELDAERCECSVAADYGAFDSLGDVLRQICLDERHHKLESLEDLARERAGSSADGSIEGHFRWTGKAWEFTHTRADGEARLTAPIALAATVPLADMETSLVPDGRASITCRAGQVRIESVPTAVSMTLVATHDAEAVES